VYARPGGTLRVSGEASNTDLEAAPLGTPSPPMSEDEKARIEAENGVLQYDLMLEIIEYGLRADPTPRIRPALIQLLPKVAVQGIVATAGSFRSGPVQIKNSEHVPPHESLAPGLVQEMCDYVNENWDDCSALHLASFVLWRLNWIHPFIEGRWTSPLLASRDTSTP